MFCLKERLPQADKPARKRVYPHENTNYSHQVPKTAPIDHPLFDEMLSFCSCLYLAQWLQDTHGDFKACNGVPLRGDNFFNRFSHIKMTATNFVKAREKALSVIANRHNPHEQCTSRITTPAANTYFMSLAQDFRCGNGVDSRNGTHLGCYCAGLRDQWNDYPYESNRHSSSLDEATKLNIAYRATQERLQSHQHQQVKAFAYCAYHDER